MRWPHHSCREMHQSLQMARVSGSGVREEPWSVPSSAPSYLPHIERPNAPDVVHPGMPSPLMGLRQDSEVTPSHGSTSGLGHLPAAHIPLRPQQRFHHVLGPAAGSHGWGGWVGSALSSPSTLSGSNPHLQSGTTMGLSSMPRNSPRSFSATSTTFLASNLGRPWGKIGLNVAMPRYPAVSRPAPIPRQSHQKRRGHVDEGTLGIHDTDGLQPVPQPNLIVVLVMCRGDLHCTWGECGGARATGDSVQSPFSHAPPFAEACGSQTICPPLS